MPTNKFCENMLPDSKFPHMQYSNLFLKYQSFKGSMIFLETDLSNCIWSTQHIIIKDRHLKIHLQNMILKKMILLEFLFAEILGGPLRSFVAISNYSNHFTSDCRQNRIFWILKKIFAKTNTGTKDQACNFNVSVIYNWGPKTHTWPILLN